MNQFFDALLRKTLWIWLPFVAFKKLFQQVLEKIDAIEEERKK